MDDDSDDDLQMMDARAEEIKATVGGTKRGLITLGEEMR